MFDTPGGYRVMHWHGGDSWVPMDEGPEHSAATHDPERAWIKGARIFRCRECEEQVAIAPEDPGNKADVNHPHPAI